MTSPAQKTIVVCTVTYNSADQLDGWWRSLCQLFQANSDFQPNRDSVAPAAALRVVAVDCASSDDSASMLEKFAQDVKGPTLTVVRSDTNLGFAGGMNRGIAELTDNDEWLFALNPDARCAPDALPALLKAFHRYDQREHLGWSEFKVGSVTAKLLRPSNQGKPPLIDACGMAWTKSWRHLDRGSGESSLTKAGSERYSAAEEVVAGTGAGTVFLVKALNDVALPADDALNSTGRPQIFDEDFHSFREDAELGLRLQRRGWRCVFEPAAIIEHLRHNLPERRKQMSNAVNLHSLKNRYLLRWLHQSRPNVFATLPALLRDLAIFGYIVVRERSSLPAYGWLWRNRGRIQKRRSFLRQRQTVANRQISRWFTHSSFPLDLR